MMALRFILMGLVASLSFELPSVQDVESWTQNGRNWAEARLAVLSSLRIEAARVFAEVSDCERVDQPESAPAVEVAWSRDDLTFDAIVDGMAKDFTADLALLEKAKPVEEVLAVVEPFREMPEADPAPSKPEIPAAETVAIASLDGFEEPVQVLPPTPIPGPSASRVEKISTAVRLTRQAMSAWAALIQPQTGEVDGEDLEDSF